MLPFEFTVILVNFFLLYFTIKLGNYIAIKRIFLECGTIAASRNTRLDKAFIIEQLSFALIFPVISVSKLLKCILTKKSELYKIM